MSKWIWAIGSTLFVIISMIMVGYCQPGETNDLIVWSAISIMAFDSFIESMKNLVK